MTLKRPRPSSPSTSSSSDIASTSAHEHDANYKRRRQDNDHDTPRNRIGDIFAYQEIFLRILSFLSPTELASVQSTSKYWSRMTLDQQLWKHLYLARYPHPHHSRLIHKSTPSGSSTPKRQLRPIARLPSRAFPPPSPSRSPSASSIPGDPVSLARGETKKSGMAVPLEDRDDAMEVGYGVRNDGVDWKVMLRLGTNWANGNALSQSTINLAPSPSPSIRSVDETDTSHQPTPTAYSEQHIALFPSFIFTSNPASPLVHVHRSATNTTTAPLGIIPPPPGWSSPHRPDNVTAICADQSVSASDVQDADVNQVLPARLAVFYQSGGFVIVQVRLDGDRVNWVREAVHPAQNRPRSIRRRGTVFLPTRGDPVVLAQMYYPTLITCTLAFHISVYTLSSTNGETTKPVHLSTMHSDVSFHPAALSLMPLTDTAPASDKNCSFRAALTYCTPLYPASWTVAVQEFVVELDQYQSGDVWRGECYNVGRGDEDDAEEDVWPRKVRPIVGIKGNTAVGVGTDGRWCVLAGEDNQIQVYSLPTHSPSLPPQRSMPIVHSQTLLAHSSAVTSIALNAGRCVSGGRDGRVLVWELDEEDEGDDEGRVGRTVGYVEVKRGGRRWKGPSGPETEEAEETSGRVRWDGLPHPASISTAARSLFLPRPPDVIDDRPPAIRQLAFDEEKIVGLVRQETSSGANSTAEVMKVWSFNG